MKTLYFDCFSGAAGDMIVGALLDAGAPFDNLKSALASLDVPGYTVEAEKVKKKGLTATKFSVHLDPNEKQPHRHLHHCVEIIDSGALPEQVKDGAKETFRRLAECEAEVHGSTIEKVHFHEVGAVDAIVDIVGAHFCLHELGIERVEASPLNIGGGTTTAAHGVLPVPAPAAALLLRDVPTYGEADIELVTPTGAALLTQFAARFGRQPKMMVDTIGYGAGSRDLNDRANVLRALIGESKAVTPNTETIVVMEANIDDMAGELFPPLLVELLAAGARDAFLTPIIGKKGRPAQLLTVLCDEGQERKIADVLFNGSKTLGVRMRKEERVCLARQWKYVLTDWGRVSIKVGTMNGEIRNVAPEFEDCKKLADDQGVPVRGVYEAAFAAAVKGEFIDE